MRGVQRLNSQVVQTCPDRQEVRQVYLVLSGPLSFNLFPPFFFPGRTTFKTHSERPTYLCDTPDASSSRNYLVRNEITALHLAMTLGRAEYANPRWRLAIEPAQPIVLSQGHTITITRPSTIQACTPEAAYILSGPPVSNISFRLRT